MESQVVINALKRVLKSKGLNYGDLAKELDISRDSIKRIFSQGTITLDRLVKICNILEIDFNDLNLLMDVEQESKDYEFTLEQEIFLAENFSYVSFYQLIFKYESIKDLAKDYDLSEGAVIKLLSKLDELKLIEWLPENEARILGPRKFASPSGPIVKKHAQRMKTLLLETTLENDDEGDNLSFPILSHRAFEKYKAKLKILNNEIRREMEVERMLNIQGDLFGVSLIMRPFDTIYDELKGFKA